MNDMQPLREALPCESTCPKCGHGDIYRRYFDAGQDTHAGQRPRGSLKSTAWVDRSDGWIQPALKDCIVHSCRCCGYQWDSDPLIVKKPSVEWLDTKPYIYWLRAAWENQGRKCANCRQKLPLENAKKNEGSVLLFCPECAATFPKSPEELTK